MRRESKDEAKLRTVVESGEKADLARALVGPALGVLVRRNAEEDEATAGLAPAVRSLVSARRRLKSGTSVRAWLLAVVTAKETPGRPHSSFPEHLPPGEEPERLAEAEDIVETAEGLLSSLGRGERDALELLVVEGLSPAEAAGMLKAPAAVVEQRAERGLTALALKVAPLMA